MKLQSTEEYEFQTASLKWLLADIELVNSPAVINSIVLNIYKISKKIKHVELVVDYLGKKMLIYLELSWMGRFFQKRIVEDVVEMLRDVLPSYEFRVVFDKEILEMSKKVAEGLYE